MDHYKSVRSKVCSAQHVSGNFHHFHYLVGLYSILWKSRDYHPTIPRCLYYHYLSLLSKGLGIPSYSFSRKHTHWGLLRWQTPGALLRLGRTFQHHPTSSGSYSKGSSGCHVDPNSLGMMLHIWSHHCLVPNLAEKIHNAEKLMERNVTFYHGKKKQQKKFKYEQHGCGNHFRYQLLFQLSTTPYSVCW